MNSIKKARKRLGLTIYDVAKKAKVSPATVSRVEREKQGASADVAERMAKVLGVSEEMILYPERFSSEEK